MNEKFDFALCPLPSLSPYFYFFFFKKKLRKQAYGKIV